MQEIVPFHLENEGKANIFYKYSYIIPFIYNHNFPFRTVAVFLIRPTVKYSLPPQIITTLNVK